MGVEFFRQKDCPVKRSSDSDQPNESQSVPSLWRHCRNSFQMLPVITSVP
jgi:hypothetical protein